MSTGKELALSSNGRGLQAALTEHLGRELRAALPRSMSPERLILSIVLAGERNPQLYDCAPASLQLAVLSMATLGLEVDSLTGQGYLLPFKQQGRRICQPVVGYKGYNTLAARSGWTIVGNVVREGDLFEYEFGTRPVLRHRPKTKGRGEILYAYAVASKPAASPIIEVLSAEELHATKARSPGARRSDSPWNDQDIGYPAMCAKTAKRRLARSFPQGYVPVGDALESSWEREQPAYVENVEGEPVVVRHTEYAAEPLQAPPEGHTLAGELAEEWLVQIPGKEGAPRDYGNPAAWARAVEQLLRRNSGNPGMCAEFWKLNAPTLEQLGRHDEQAAERVAGVYAEVTR